MAASAPTSPASVSPAAQRDRQPPAPTTVPFASPLPLQSQMGH